MRAYIDLGFVPFEEKTREHRELLDAFEMLTGVRLTWDDFMARPNPDTGDALPNFNFIPTVTDSMSMLTVEYFFLHQAGSDTFDDMFAVSSDTMNFHLFEQLKLT